MHGELRIFQHRRSRRQSPCPLPKPAPSDIRILRLTNCRVMRLIFSYCNHSISSRLFLLPIFQALFSLLNINYKLLHYEVFYLLYRPTVEDSHKGNHHIHCNYEFVFFPRKDKFYTARLHLIKGISLPEIYYFFRPKNLSRFYYDNHHNRIFRNPNQVLPKSVFLSFHSILL
jgi:hypothetical protein